MEKSFCINPVNDEMKISVEAVYLLNEFKRKFETRRSFMQVVVDKMPKYDNMEGFNQLTAFWNSRLKSQEMNTDIETVLELLKAE